MFASFPRLFAGYNVLLRLLQPRHPPCALKNLTQKSKMLASTVQFSRYGQSHLPLAPAPQRCITARVGWFIQIQWSVQPVSRLFSRLPGLRLSFRPSPQDPTTCQAPSPCRPLSTLQKELYLRAEPGSVPNNRCSTLEHLLTDIRSQTRLWIAFATSAP